MKEIVWKSVSLATLYMSFRANTSTKKGATIETQTKYFSSHLVDELLGGNGAKYRPQPAKMAGLARIHNLQEQKYISKLDKYISSLRQIQMSWWGLPAFTTCENRTDKVNASPPDHCIICHVQVDWRVSA